MSPIFVFFFFITLLNPTLSQRTYKEINRECQCAPSNWNPEEFETMKSSLDQMKELGKGMNITNLNVEITEMLNNITTKTLETMMAMINTTIPNIMGLGNSFPNCVENCTDMDQVIKTMLGFLGVNNGTSPLMPASGNMMQVMAMLNNYAMKIEWMEGKMNETGMKINEYEGWMEETKYKLVDLNATVTSQNLKMMSLKKQVSAAKCHNPVLALAGKNPLKEVKVKVSSMYGQNESMEITVATISVNSSNFWCANEPNLAEEYIEVTFNKSTEILGVITRGRGNYDQWVSSFRVDLWVNGDMESGESGGNVSGGVVGGMFKPMKDEFGLDAKIFPGNQNRNEVKITYFPHPHSTPTIRFVPLTTPPTRNGFSNKCTRLDFIICAEP